MGPRFEKIANTNVDLHQLEELILPRLPDSSHILNICRIAKGNHFSKKVIVQFYKYADPTSEETTAATENDPFVVCIEMPNIHAKKGIVILPPQHLTATMIETFDKFIGWDRAQVFQSCPSPLWEHLQRLCEKHNNANPDNSLGIPGIMLKMGKDEALAIDAPETDDKIVLRGLDDGDVPLVVDKWKWAVDHSREQVRESIRTLVSCGLFVRIGEEEDLASSTLLSPLGVYNVLYTMEKYRRMGYAEKVLKWVSKRGAIQMGIDAMAEVESWNDASKWLLEKVGYREVFQTRWYYFEPEDGSE